MRKSIAALVVVLSVLITAESFGGYKPPEGMVPDADTAIKIAEAIWLPIYGKDIYKKKPFQAVLKNGTWKVTGSLRKGHLGGVPEARISKENGCVLEVYHSK